MLTKLQDLRKMSEKHERLETLINRVNYDSLLSEHIRQNPQKAKGIDGVSKEEYGKNLEENLKNLVSNMKKFSYRPKPVLRTYIPKPNGDLRPLGIPSYEDKLVQGVMGDILTQVYEPRFLECSYGFRPGRGQHQAIKKINDLIMHKRVNYILDCDIKSFFDNVDHSWLVKFLEHDIADKNFIRYIVRIIRSGIVEDGIYRKSEKGVAQGELISPVLSNVYLHYVLDLWFEKRIKKELKGEAYLVRFADDFVIMFEHEEEACKVYSKLEERLKVFGLELAKEKSRILPFGRNSKSDETFDFLGFNHFNSKTRRGYYSVGHKVAKKKVKMFKARLKEWLKNNRNVLKFVELMNKLNIKLTGVYRYYGINGTIPYLRALHSHALFTTFKWLNRRSQRKSFALDKFLRVWNVMIRPPRIYVNIWYAQ